MKSIGERRERFAELHRSGCFVIPNPWDRGSARLLAHLGFEALATTSAGLQFSRGEPDTARGLSLEVVLTHIAEIVGATALPVNADFQAGYARDADGVRASVARCVAAGVAGLSIEDASGDEGEPLYALPVAVERIRAARAAIGATGAQVLLTARAESFLVGHPDPLEDARRRLAAYAEAGADVLFAPGLRRLEEIVAIVRTVAPRPVNVLVMGSTDLGVADLAGIGVRRISVGSALARVAQGALLDAARRIAEHGSFAGLAAAPSFAELNGIFAAAAGAPSRRAPEAGAGSVPR